MGYIYAIIIFALIILIHELGHFLAARKFQVKVEEFGLGLPPRAKKLFVDKKGTLFSLNWLPFGGFVKITGEMPLFLEIYDENGKKLTNDEILEKITNKQKIFDKNKQEISKKESLEILKKIKQEKAPYNLMNKPAWQQSIILLAGIFFNFVLAFIIFSILFFVGVKPIGVNNIIKTDLDLKLLPNIEQAQNIGFLEKKSGALAFPLKNSLAEKYGIKNFDWITKINDKNIKTPEDIIKIFKENKNREINIVLRRSENSEKEIEKNMPTLKNSKEINLKVKLPENGKLGFYIQDYYKINQNFKYKYNLANSVKYGFLETINQIKFTFVALGDLGQKIFSPKNDLERKQAIDSMSGPIGTVKIINDVSYKGFVFLMILAAIISINLGVMNLLPIPALDGGRFFIIAINEFFKKIFNKKIIAPYTEAIIHSMFFIILIGLIILISYNDISKF